MFQESVYRLMPLFKPQNILVATGEEQVETLSTQVGEIPFENYILEPYGKGTAPCIGLAAIHIMNKNPNAVMAVVTADHYIKKVDRFQKILQIAINVAEKDHLVILGISPDHPSTGYGYIEQGEKLISTHELPIFRVQRFTEKPDKKTAVKMVESGDYSWNSGMFIWRVDRIMEEFERQMPDLFNQLTRISNSIGKPNYEKVLDRTWSKVKKQTIDYGVMEGASDVVVIPSEIGWSDVGSWTSLANILEGDEKGNAFLGNNICIDTSRSLIFGGKRLIATIGLEDMIIVDTDDALLVCPKMFDQRVREIVNKLEEGKLKEYL
jgi:mannose-1-phosphate guanylyltransferase